MLRGRQEAEDSDSDMVKCAVYLAALLWQGTGAAGHSLEGLVYRVVWAAGLRGWLWGLAGNRSEGGEACLLCGPLASRLAGGLLWRPSLC